MKGACTSGRWNHSSGTVPSLLRIASLLRSCGKLKGSIHTCNSKITFSKVQLQQPPPLPHCEWDESRGSSLKPSPGAPEYDAFGQTVHISTQLRYKFWKNSWWWMVILNNISFLTTVYGFKTNAIFTISLKTKEFAAVIYLGHIVTFPHCPGCPV